MDQRINLLTKVANKRKRKADDSTSGDTVNSSEISLSCLEAEKSKVKVSKINTVVVENALQCSIVVLCIVSIWVDAFNDKDNHVSRVLFAVFIFNIFLEQFQKLKFHQTKSVLEIVLWMVITHAG